MGNYVDKNRRIVRTSRTTALSNHVNNGTIVKVVPTRNYDNRRNVFFIQKITSANQFGLVSASGLVVTVLAGSGTANGSTVSWVQQTYTMVNDVYGIIGIDIATSLVRFDTGITSYAIPLCIVGSSTSTIPFLYNMSISGSYLCMAKQEYINNKWVWVNEPYQVLNSAESANFSNSSDDNVSISFIRNELVYKRDFNFNDQSTFQFYNDYKDVVNTRYIMPDDRSLQSGIMSECSVSVGIQELLLTSSLGTFKQFDVWCENDINSSALKVYCRIPLSFYALYSPNIIKYYDTIDLYLNNSKIYSNTYNNTLETKIELIDNSNLVINVNGRYGLFQPPCILQKFTDSLTSYINPIYYNDNNDNTYSLTNNIATECYGAVGIQPVSYTVTGESFYSYPTYTDSISTECYGTVGNDICTYTITSEVFYNYATYADSISTECYGTVGNDILTLTLL